MNDTLHTKTVKTDGCWFWTGALNAKGYGVLHIGSLKDGTRRTVLAHRLSYELNVGDIPEGTELDHLCRNTLCVRPSHLEAVTHLENVRRGSKAQASHCRHGHPFDEVNTVRNPNGTRRCRACSNRRSNEAYHRRRP